MTNWPDIELLPVFRPGMAPAESSVGLRVRVPAPAFTTPILPLVTPLPPLIALLIVRLAVPGVQMLRGEKPLVWLSTPPEIVEVVPSRTRMPPELLLMGWPAAMTRLAPL